MTGQGNLERTVKVREKLWNFEISGNDNFQKGYLFCSREKTVVSRKRVQAHLPPH